MITIVDYGLGNVRAFENVYKQLDLPVSFARCADDINRADKIILPGVGSFDWAISLLEKSGMRGALDDAVMSRCIPVLGICVGMQIMAESSEEGVGRGLGWIPGRVVRIKNDSDVASICLPHMGWNDVEAISGQSIFNGSLNPRYYFLHSYHFVPRSEEHVIAKTCYSREFVCAVRNKNIFGVQFHPEKSHDFGKQLLSNFALI
jgi:glutamine amidotransferase